MNERDNRLDKIRAIAAMCVVINHSVESIFCLSVDTINSYSCIQRIFAHSAFTFGRLGVPLFLMLSGYLLLNRDYDIEGVKRFYRKNLLGLLLCWEIWVTIYYIFLCWQNNIPVELMKYLKIILFFENVGLPHTWYMPVIIGIYCFIPFGANLLRRMSNRAVLVLLGISYFYNFVIPSINLILLSIQQSQISINLDFSLTGSCYVFYLLLGYLVATNKENIINIMHHVKNKILILLCFFVTFTLTVSSQISFFKTGFTYNVWYNFALLPFCAFSFLMIMFTCNQRIFSERITRELALCSFGIFLIHELVLQYFISIFLQMENRVLAVIFLSIVTYICSLLISFIVSRNKYGARLVLYKKYIVKV